LKRLYDLYGKKLLPLTILLLLILSLLSAFNVNITRVSATESPCIKVIPENTVDPTLTPGQSYTVSIYTDYAGPDITMYEFTLSYDPNVLHGGVNNTDTWDGDGVTNVFNATKTPVVPDSEEVYVDQTLMLREWNYTIDYSIGEITFIREVPGSGVEIEATYNAPPGLGVDITAMYLYNGVTNGDVVVPGPTNKKVSFIAGEFNNEAGNLSRTLGFFFEEGYVELGPGTLAYVTFTVVGKGNSDITIGSETILWGWDDWDWIEYPVIDAATMPDHIQDGYFDNRFLHDVAVVSLNAQAETTVGSLVSINVTVANIGKSDEMANVTILYGSTYIDSQNLTLLAGASETVSFSWDTEGVAQGTYTINATATIPVDDDPMDNWNTTTFLVAHDVRVVSVTAPTKEVVGSLVPVGIEVANIGSFVEVANVTILYGSTYIDSQNETVSLSWNTAAVSAGNHTLNATATIPVDDDPTDNWNTTTILLVEHDVRVVSVTAPTKEVVGSLVSINVTIANSGVHTEVANVTVRHDSTYIDSQNVTLLENSLVELEHRGRISGQPHPERDCNHPGG